MPALLFLALVTAWQLAGSHGRIAFWVLPTPMGVLKVFIDYPALLLSHLIPTLIESVSGLLLAVCFGSLAALAMHVSNPVKQLLYPYLVISQTIPVVAVAPLVVLAFGFGISAKIFTVVLVCFFPVTLGLFDGLQQVSPEQTRLLRSMGASTWKTYRYLKIPASLPSFFTGLKLAATYSVMGAVFGEWLGGNSGLGIYMTRATKSFQTAHVFAAVLVIALLSMALFGIVAGLERILLGWHFQKIEEYEDLG